MREKLQKLSDYLMLGLSQSEFETIEKMCKSATAQQQKIDNSLPLHLLQNALVTSLLIDWLEESGYTFNSVYRCPSLNIAVGGVEKSRHLECRAIDIQLTYNDSKVTIQHIVNEFNRILFPIAEVNYYYRKGNMLHVDWKYK